MWCLVHFSWTWSSAGSKSSKVTMTYSCETSIIVSTRICKREHHFRWWRGPVVLVSYKATSIYDSKKVSVFYVSKTNCPVIFLLQSVRNYFNMKQNYYYSGTFLNLKDPDWALGIEVILKSLVYCFCCHDYHDERILKEIMQRVIRDGKRPSIITSKFEVGNWLISRVQNL